MVCPLCNEEVEQLAEEPASHLVVTLSGTLKEQHVHVHGSLENKLMVAMMVDAIIKECGLEGLFIKQGAI